MEKADANHDGYVTPEEFKAARSTQFDRLDRNGDDLVTLSEFPAWPSRTAPRPRR
ncbi:hypothetical protein [Caulobacter sp. UC70_42]|uniref:hypothetical protein n=1 Tax=Caulobacter sp. UC70_42 TaxID=3374551 RepID=UPI0037568800